MSRREQIHNTSAAVLHDDLYCDNDDDHDHELYDEDNSYDDDDEGEGDEEEEIMFASTASPKPTQLPLDNGENPSFTTPPTGAVVRDPQEGEEERQEVVAARSPDEAEDSHEEESELERREREERESLELARMLMAEEAMASYQHHFDLLCQNEDEFTQEDREAYRAAMVEEEREQAADIIAAASAGIVVNEDDEDDQDDDDDHRDDGNAEGDLSYEAMLRLSERIGDVKTERWQFRAPQEIAKLPVFTFDPEATMPPGAADGGIGGNGCTSSGGSTADNDDEDAASCCNKCLVCQCEYEKNDLLRRLPCGHYFHADCIGQWLEEKSFCPYCRRSIVPEEDEDEQEE